MRATVCGDESTTAGVVEGNDESTEVEKLKKLMATAAGAGVPRGGQEMTFEWPKQGDIIPERQSYSAFAKAFPKLFPRGGGDIASLVASLDAR